MHIREAEIARHLLQGRAQISAGSGTTNDVERDIVRLREPGHALYELLVALALVQRSDRHDDLLAGSNRQAGARLRLIARVKGFAIDAVQDGAHPFRGNAERDDEVPELVAQGHDGICRPQAPIEKPAADRVLAGVQRFVPADGHDEFLAMLLRQVMARDDVRIRPVHVDDVEWKRPRALQTLCSLARHPPVTERVEPLEETRHDDERGMPHRHAIQGVFGWNAFARCPAAPTEARHRVHGDGRDHGYVAQATHGLQSIQHEDAEIGLRLIREQAAERQHVRTIGAHAAHAARLAPNCFCHSSSTTSCQISR